MEEANEQEEQWRTLFEMSKLLEKVIVGMMKEFENVEILSAMKMNVCNAKLIALNEWQGFNSLVKEAR